RMLDSRHSTAPMHAPHPPWTRDGAARSRFLDCAGLPLCRRRTTSRSLPAMRVTRAILAVSATTFLLVACGGGGDAPARATLEGVAAVGAPLAGATVQARCAGGASVTPVQTGASGAWSLTVPQA